VKVKKQVILVLIVMNVFTLFQAVHAYDYYINKWPANYRNPLYYYPENVWSQWTFAKNAWNNEDCDCGDLAPDPDPDGNQPVVVMAVSKPGVSWKAKTSLTAGPDYTWAIGTVQLNNAKTYVYGEKRCICLHEVGHLWSLKDINTGDAVMDIQACIDSEYSYVGPQDDDKAGVNELY